MSFKGSLDKIGSGLKSSNDTRNGIGMKVCPAAGEFKPLYLRKETISSAGFYNDKKILAIISRLTKRLFKLLPLGDI
jgi:hypothetical protein